MVAKCSKCGRPLADPESVQRRMGPVCWARFIAEKSAAMRGEEKRHVEMDVLAGPGDIILKRSPDGAPVVNVELQEVLHSPTGFEWGYGGSGPAELAYNILLLFTDRKTAMRLHQEFKWRYIATMPEQGGTIKKEEVIRWIQRLGGECFDNSGAE